MNADMLNKLQLMRGYFQSGKTQTAEFRIEMLQSLKRVILEKEAAIFAALKTDLNKSPEEAVVTETGLLLQEINYLIKHLRRWMRPQPVRTNWLNFPSKSHLQPSPRGVVLIIGPWNFPLQLVLIPLAGAIAAGNVAVIKPSEWAPATAAVVEEIIIEAFPREHVTVIQGEGAQLVPELMESFRFDHIFYTGSIPVGRAIYSMAAPQLIPVTLELGGKAPCIVEADANIPVAARRITVGKFTNAGQMCVCPDYLLVHNSVKEELVREISQCIRRFYGDAPMESEGYGRIINKRNFSRLLTFLEQGRIIKGGNYNTDTLSIAPTLIDELKADDPIMQEEIFGPLLPVFGFSNKEEAMAIIQAHPNPLSFYVFTSSAVKEKDWINALQFGNGCVNNTAWQFSNHYLPFGGIASSGTGAYHGKYSFDLFTHYKAIMKSPTWFDPSIKYPPLKGKLGLLKRIFR